MEAFLYVTHTYISTFQFRWATSVQVFYILTSFQTFFFFEQQKKLGSLKTKQWLCEDLIVFMMLFDFPNYV